MSVTILHVVLFIIYILMTRIALKYVFCKHKSEQSEIVVIIYSIWLAIHVLAIGCIIGFLLVQPLTDILKIEIFKV